MNCLSNPIKWNLAVAFKRNIKSEKGKREAGVFGKRVVVPVAIVLALAPCRCSSPSRALPAPLEVKEATETPTCSPSFISLPFSPLLETLASRTGHHGPAAVNRTSPPLEASPSQSKRGNSSALSSSSSPCRESSREARNRPRRLFPLPLRPPPSSSLAVVSDLPTPRRRALRTQGEHTNLSGILAVLLSL